MAMQRVTKRRKFIVAVLMALATALAAGCAAQAAPGPSSASASDSARSSASQTSTAASTEQELKRAPFSPDEWKTNFAKRTVKLNEFLGGGPPKDGILSIDDPKFVSVKDADRWLDDREAVEVVDINGDVRAYPQQVLIWHEIVNDVVGGDPVIITY